MKLTVLTLMGVFVCACATTPRPAPVAINHADYQPPVDQEVVWNQKLEADHQQSEADKMAREAQTYRNSLNKIEEQLGTERLQLLMCHEVHGLQGQECWALLNKFCEISMLIDTRSGHHSKEYCGKEFLEYHNPNIQHKN